MDINMNGIDYSASAEKARQWYLQKAPLDLYDAKAYATAQGVSVAAGVFQDVARGDMDSTDEFPKQAARCLALHGLLVMQGD